VVLQSAADNLRREAVLRFTSTTIAKLLPLLPWVARVVLVRVGAPALRNDVLSLAQKVIGRPLPPGSAGRRDVRQVQYPDPFRLPESVDGFEYSWAVVS